MREYLHDLEHEIAAMAALAEKGDKQAKKRLREIYAELRQRKYLGDGSPRVNNGERKNEEVQS